MSRENQVFAVTSARGAPFNIRIVRHGERYGLDDCLTHGEGAHDRPFPLVEFYDARLNRSHNGEPTT